MDDSKKLSILLSWCTDIGIHIDPRLVLTEDIRGSISVHNCSGSYIDPLTTLVTIPKDAVLSVRSCTLSNEIPFVPYGHGAHLALSLALYSELMQGSRSKWSGYLQSLPQTPVWIALLWGSDEGQLTDNQDMDMVPCEDLRHAAVLAAGTEIRREYRGEEGGLALNEVREYYSSVAQPILAQATAAGKLPVLHGIGFAGFLHAYTLVCSRAFLVDAYHGLSMVPIADAFNHIQENHVHLESEYDVCTSCGSLEQCPHDQEETEDIAGPQSLGSTGQALPFADGYAYDSAQVASSQSRSGSGTSSVSGASVTYDVTFPQSSRTLLGIYAPASPHGPTSSTNTRAASSAATTLDTCDMVSNLPIPPGSEVFNTYGEHLTNAQLLARYGFALDGNENDVVMFDVDDLPRMHWDSAASILEAREASGGKQGIVNIAHEVLQLWPRYARWEDSNLVYNTHALSPTTMRRNHTEERGVNLPRHPYRNASRSQPVPLCTCVNSDARISHELWVCCALFSLAQLHAILPSEEPNVSHESEDEEHGAIPLLVQLADRQLDLEAQQRRAEFEVEEDHDENDDENNHTLREDVGTQASDKTLALLAQSVTWICAFSSRARRLSQDVRTIRTPAQLQAVAPDTVSHVDVDVMDVDLDSDADATSLGIEELGDMLDALPPTYRYTRLALQQVLGERSILESCRCAWEEFEAFVRGGVGIAGSEEETEGEDEDEYREQS